MKPPAPPAPSTGTSIQTLLIFYIDDDSGASAEVTEVPQAEAGAEEESREAEGSAEDVSPKKAAENGSNGVGAEHQHVNGKSAANPEADCN